MTVRSGLERLVDEGFERLRHQRVGLVTHPAAVDRRYRSAAELFVHTSVCKLVTLFGPEHGFTGAAQDLEGVPVETSPFAGVACYSLYGKSVESLRPTAEQLTGLDVLVIDMVDVGSRYYTFQATMLFCMQEAAKIGLRVVVLDRPNPLNGVTIEGPMLREGFESFVGIHPICTRHGMTLGELTRFYKQQLKIDVDVEIVTCEGWRRAGDFVETSLPWVLPSPNMPTFKTACVYPGMCLIEGTNLSEGRGTTRPFELCGFPGIDAYKLAKRLNEEQLPGVTFRPATFKPTFQKHAGQLCGGVQLHLTDRERFQPVRTGLAVLAALRSATGSRFAWRTKEYEFVRNPIAIDLLFGSDRERLALEDGVAWREVAANWEREERQFLEQREPALIY